MIATATRTMAATGALRFLAGGVVALPRRVCVSLCAHAQSPLLVRVGCVEPCPGMASFPATHQ